MVLSFSVPIDYVVKIVEHFKKNGYAFSCMTQVAFNYCAVLYFTLPSEISLFKFRLLSTLLE